MRHVWGFVSALGLLVLVVFGTWACLTASTNDPDTSRSVLIAIGGAALMIVGIVARGSGSAAIAKVRRGIGGLGLVVAVVSGAMTLFAVLIDPSAVPTLLLVTLVAMLAWAQGIAAQVGISVRVSFWWLAVLALFGAVVLAVVAGLVAVLVGALGLDARAGTSIAIALVIGLSGAIVTAWARGRPDRSAVTKVVGRAALGRAGPVDLELLAAGPAPILRRRREAAADHAEADSHLAAADSHLAERDGASSVDPLSNE
jgi:hypothetical protein